MLLKLGRKAGAAVLPDLDGLAAKKMIRVLLPYHLRNLARVSGEVELDLKAPVTIGSILNQIEAGYPMLRGTIRDHVTLRRRPFIRFFACEHDLSNETVETVLPEPIATGAEPFMIIGAIAGG
jgi:molybdopterin synthase sulfur carrier subunit